MTQLFKEKFQAILTLTQEKLNCMVKVWEQSFSQDMCEGNLDKLYDNCESLYNGIISESVEKEYQIKAEIKALKKEVGGMLRKLGTAISVQTAIKCIEEDEESSTPLLSRKQNLENILADLKTCWEQRRQQNDNMILEEEALCKELGMEERVRQTEPLSAHEVQEFRQYLDALKQKKFEILVECCELRVDIKKFARILGIQEDAVVQNLIKKFEVELQFKKLGDLQTLQRNYRNKEIQKLHDRIKMHERLLTPKLEAPKLEAPDSNRYYPYNRGGKKETRKLKRSRD